jgi:hypothetical protein
LYFLNSVSQSFSERGGRIPVIGRHSVMLNPDSVRRVTPPTTITAKVRPEERRSQRPTAGDGRIGNRGGGDDDGGGLLTVEEKRASNVRRW